MPITDQVAFEAKPCNVLLKQSHYLNKPRLAEPRIRGPQTLSEIVQY